MNSNKELNGSQEIAPYDSIAESYTDSVEEEIGNKYVFDPALIRILGNLQDQKILDLACGDGYFSRKMKGLGASEIIGIDISTGMIKLAQSAEKQNPQGINYQVGDARKLPDIDQFDIILGKYLLHYSGSKEEITQMAESIFKNLRPGGRFVGLLPFLDNGLQSDPKYGFTQEAEKPLEEGDKIKVTIYKDGKPACTFDNNFWRQSTYEIGLKNAGFIDIKWHQLTPNREGIEKFGQEFWQDYIDNPNHIILEATKPA